MHPAAQFARTLGKLTVDSSRAKQSREHAAKHYELAEREQQFQHTVKGTLSREPVETVVKILFDIVFIHEYGYRRDSQLGEPFTRFGFSSLSAPAGSVPYAHVQEWIQDEDFNFVGANVVVGVHNPSMAITGTAPVTSTKFSATLHCSFQGYGQPIDPDDPADAGPTPNRARIVQSGGALPGEPAYGPGGVPLLGGGVPSGTNPSVGPVSSPGDPGSIPGGNTPVSNPKTPVVKTPPPYKGGIYEGRGVINGPNPGPPGPLGGGAWTLVKKWDAATDSADEFLAIPGIAAVDCYNTTDNGAHDKPPFSDNPRSRFDLTRTHHAPAKVEIHTAANETIPVLTTTDFTQVRIVATDFGPIPGQARRFDGTIHKEVIYHPTSPDNVGGYWYSGDKYTLKWLGGGKRGSGYKVRLHLKCWRAGVNNDGSFLRVTGPGGDPGGTGGGTFGEIGLVANMQDRANGAAFWFDPFSDGGFVNDLRLLGSVQWALGDAVSGGQNLIKLGNNHRRVEWWANSYVYDSRLLPDGGGYPPEIWCELWRDGNKLRAGLYTEDPALGGVVRYAPVQNMSPDGPYAGHVAGHFGIVTDWFSRDMGIMDMQLFKRD